MLKVQHTGEQIGADGVSRRLYFVTPKYAGRSEHRYAIVSGDAVAALVRSDEIVLEAADVERELVTPEDWAWLAATYPDLLGQFNDQPTG